jgi:proteasome lid subunit RPN8/RPN11
MVLVLGRRERDELVDHCKMSSSIETCGVLAGVIQGRSRIVKRIFKTRNVLGSSSAYQIDAEELLQIFLQAERDSIKVLGFYHSHPFWSAKPSGVDASSAHYPGYSYLIYSVPEDDLKSYIWSGDKFVPERVRVV